MPASATQLRRSPRAGLSSRSESASHASGTEKARLSSAFMPNRAQVQRSIRYLTTSKITLSASTTISAGSQNDQSAGSRIGMFSPSVPRTQEW